MAETPDVHGLTRASEARGSAIPLPPRRWKTRLLLPVMILAILVGLFLFSTWDLLMPATTVRVEPVIVKAIAGDAPGSVTVQAPGWLEPDPHPQVVPALTGGVVRELLVLEGDAVEADQVVARLIDEDAKLARDRARAMLDERRAATAAADAELTAAKRELDTLVAPTENVARARADLAAAVAERARLDARIRAAESKMLATKDEFDRKSRLVESEVVSRGEVERLELRLGAERAQLEATRAETPVLDAKMESATAHSVAKERALELLIQEKRAVALAEAKLEAAKSGERTAAAALAEAELALERTEVRAPSAGIVMQRVVSPGASVRTSGPVANSVVLELYDPEKLQVRVDVPLADAAQVGLAQRAEIVVDALPDRVFEGVVARLVHVADIAKNTVEVKVTVRDPLPVLKPQMLARVRFLSAEPEDGSRENVRQRIFAPRDALRSSGGDSSTVFVVADRKGSRGRAEVRNVTVGTTVVEDHVEVTSGLRPGDRVVVNAPPGLEPGARIVVQGGTH